MKNVQILLIASFIFTGCADKKTTPKVALDSVITIHDKVMGTDELALKNKAVFDSIVTAQKLTAKDTAFMLREQLAAADSAMDNWMHGFEPEHKGKTDDETVAYFNAQKKQITAIDSQLNSAVAVSGKYLLKIKKK